MKEKLRDKTRDNLINALNSLGVKAEMAERKGAPRRKFTTRGGIALWGLSTCLKDLSGG